MSASSSERATEVSEARGGKSKCSTVRYVVPAAVQSSWESCKSVGDVLIDHRCVPDGQSHLWSTIQYNRWILYFSVALGEWLEPPTDYESLVSWRLQSFSHPLLPVLCAHCVWRLALVRIAQHHSGVPGLKISLNWKPYVTNTSKVLQHLISERPRVVSRWINFDDFDSMPMLTVIVASLQIATGELGLSIMLRLQCHDRLD